MNGPGASIINKAFIEEGEMYGVGKKSIEDAIKSIKQKADFWFFRDFPSAVYAILIMLSSIVPAYLLNGKIYGSSFARTLYFLPYISNIVAISVVFKPCKAY